uniref:Uncharacterized protein n=1 Tax=Meloidogyne javanica TaxID=6303 RepID=A0A915LSL0_MELJA
MKPCVNCTVLIEEESLATARYPYPYNVIDFPLELDMKPYVQTESPYVKGNTIYSLYWMADITENYIHSDYNGESEQDCHKFLILLLVKLGEDSNRGNYEINMNLEYYNDCNNICPPPVFEEKP